LSIEIESRKTLINWYYQGCVPRSRSPTHRTPANASLSLSLYLSISNTSCPLVHLSLLPSLSLCARRNNQSDYTRSAKSTGQLCRSRPTLLAGKKPDGGPASYSPFLHRSEVIRNSFPKTSLVKDFLTSWNLSSSVGRLGGTAPAAEHC